MIRFSYLEIYNESIIDLLSPEEKNLDIRENPEKGIIVQGLTEVEVESTT